MSWTHRDSMSVGDDGIRSHVGESEAQRDESTSASIRRLSFLGTPTVGKRLTKRRTQDSTMPASKLHAAKPKGTGSGRKLGKLAQLMNMPLDVFFEITAHLEPVDILRLSRVSKQFRSTFASKHSRHIWRAARRNLLMPECPPDLTELQFASLMFEQTCQACGSRAYKVDYSLRVRFCSPCFGENVQSGTKIMKRHSIFVSYLDIFTLVPRSSLQYPNNYSNLPLARWSTVEGGDAMTNRRQNAYYVPEILMVIQQYQDLGENAMSLRRFVEHQQTLASQMMDNAIVLAEWAKKHKTQKAIESSDHVKNREASIEAKLLELGWDKADYPSDSKWHALMKQPRELTPHLWKILRPKLETLLEQHKFAQAQKVIRIRRNEREWEFEPFWDEFVISRSWDATQPWTLPRFVDACELPAINKMLAEDESRIPVTAERWQAVVHSVPGELTEFANRVMCDVVKLLDASDLIDGTDTNTIDACEDPDPSIFERATSLISCGVADCHNLFTFPAILQEEHVTPYRYFNFCDRKWADLLSRLQHEPEVFRVASFVLKTLGLPNDTPLVAFDGFERKLLCLCGNPKFRGPLDFRSLVRHIADENKIFESQVRERRNTPYTLNLILHNDHDLTSEQPCFKLLSFHDVCALKNEERQQELPNFFSHLDLYCKNCWILNLRLHKMTDAGEVAYHMKAKHLKLDYQGDVMSKRELKRWKKKHPHH